MVGKIVLMNRMKQLNFAKANAANSLLKCRSLVVRTRSVVATNDAFDKAVCNGVNDCGVNDYSEEKACALNHKCIPKQFQCESDKFLALAIKFVWRKSSAITITDAWMIIQKDQKRMILVCRMKSHFFRLHRIVIHTSCYHLLDNGVQRRIPDCDGCSIWRSSNRSSS